MVLSGPLKPSALCACGTHQLTVASTLTLKSGDSAFSEIHTRAACLFPDSLEFPCRIKILRGLSGDPDIEFGFVAELPRLIDLFMQRQKKYGPSNIAAFGAQGVVVRANDKLARLRAHYFEGREDTHTDESVQDTWMDLAVYAIIGLMCHHDTWE